VSLVGRDYKNTVDLLILVLPFAKSRLGPAFPAICFNNRAVAFFNQSQTLFPHGLLYPLAIFIPDVRKMQPG